MADANADSSRPGTLFESLNRSLSENAGATPYSDALRNLEPHFGIAPQYTTSTGGHAILLPLSEQQFLSITEIDRLLAYSAIEGGYKNLGIPNDKSGLPAINIYRSFIEPLGRSIYTDISIRTFAIDAMLARGEATARQFVEGTLIPTAVRARKADLTFEQLHSLFGQAYGQNIIIEKTDNRLGDSFSGQRYNLSLPGKPQEAFNRRNGYAKYLAYVFAANKALDVPGGMILQATPYPTVLPLIEIQDDGRVQMLLGGVPEENLAAALEILSHPERDYRPLLHRIPVVGVDSLSWRLERKNWKPPADLREVSLHEDKPLHPIADAMSTAKQMADGVIQAASGVRDKVLPTSPQRVIAKAQKLEAMADQAAHQIDIALAWSRYRQAIEKGQAASALPQGTFPPIVSADYEVTEVTPSQTPVNAPPKREVKDPDAVPPPPTERPGGVGGKPQEGDEPDARNHHARFAATSGESFDDVTAPFGANKRGHRHNGGRGSK